MLAKVPDVRSPVATISGILSVVGTLLLIVSATPRHGYVMPYGVAVIGLSALATEKKLVSDVRWLWFLRAAGAATLVASLIVIFF